MDALPAATAPDSALEPTPCLLCGRADAPVVQHVAAQFAPADGTTYTFRRCPSCGLVFLSPRVPLARLGAYYDDEYPPHRGYGVWGRYATYVEEGDRRMDQARVRRLAELLPLDAGSAVLDFGCGRPTFLRALHDATGCRAVGLDTSDRGWRHEPAFTRGLALRRGELEALAPTERFDAITLWHALEHHYAPRTLLEGLRAHAKPGAWLVVEVPDHGGLTRRLQGRHWGGWHTPRHTALYARDTLQAMLERAGWRVERMLPSGTMSPFVLWWLGGRARAGDHMHRSMEGEFLPYVAGMLAALPVLALGRWVRLGVQTAIARAPG
ncbi:MAG: class I SAM-dependent methyltransferase [Gemmatimonadales bacterium]|nr:class I SAM-dependent methyltransferase [Gemmatimonadales bacterium]